VDALADRGERQRPAREQLLEGLVDLRVIHHAPQRRERLGGSGLDRPALAGDHDDIPRERRQLDREILALDVMREIRVGERVAALVRDLQADPAELAVALDDAAKHALLDEDRAVLCELHVYLGHRAA
jgi:hypothetical protein